MSLLSWTIGVLPGLNSLIELVLVPGRGVTRCTMLCKIDAGKGTMSMGVPARTAQFKSRGKWEVLWYKRIGEWFMNFRDRHDNFQIEQIDRYCGELPTTTPSSSQTPTELAVGVKSPIAELFVDVCEQIWRLSEQMRAHAHSGDLDRALSAAAAAHPLLSAVGSYRFRGYGDSDGDGDGDGQTPDIAMGGHNVRRTARAIEIALEPYGPLTDEFGRELFVGLLYKNATSGHGIVSPLVALALAANGNWCENITSDLSALSPSARMILGTSYKFGVAAPVGTLVPLPCHFVYDALPLPLDEWVRAMKSLERGGHAAPAARVEALLPNATARELALIASQLRLPVKKSANKTTLIAEITKSFGGSDEMQRRVASAAGPPPDPFIANGRTDANPASKPSRDPAAELLYQKLNFSYMPTSHIQLGVSDLQLDRVRRDVSKTCDLKN